LEDIRVYQINLDEYSIHLANAFPETYYAYHKNAHFVDNMLLEDEEGELLYVALAKGAEWPFLIVVQKYQPGPKVGFHPGILLIPKTQLLLIGAGTRLLAYSWNPPKKLWEEQILVGFWHWRQFQDIVLMASETELAAWDIYGNKLWNRATEPPWTYSVENNILHLQVMDIEQSFPLRTGPIK
jgi:hypothetical protein